MWSRPAEPPLVPSRRCRRALWLLIFGVHFAGCVSLDPASDTRLTQIDSVEAFAGTYRNRALQADPDSHDSLNLLLSCHIWPDEDAGLHDRIDVLRVTVLSSRRLRLEALAGALSLKSSVIDAEKSGGIRDGRLLLYQGGSVAGFKPGEPMLGRVSRRDLIGLNGEGNLVLQSRETAWGLAYLLVPVFVRAWTEYVFDKILE